MLFKKLRGVNLPFFHHLYPPPKVCCSWKVLFFLILQCLCRFFGSQNTKNVVRNDIRCIAGGELTLFLPLLRAKKCNSLKTVFSYSKMYLWVFWVREFKSDVKNSILVFYGGEFAFFLLLSPPKYLNFIKTLKKPKKTIFCNI